MKRLLIISHAMEIGGAEKALLGLLNSIDYTKYYVDLFLCRHEGELMKDIPKHVNLLPMNQSKYLAIPLIELVKQRKFDIFFGRIKAKIISKFIVYLKNIKKENMVELTNSHRYTYKYFDFINENVNYDFAISFLTPHYICLHKCNAKKRLAWIHTDYSKIDCDVTVEYEMWNGFDFVSSISDNCTESILSIMPKLKNKIVRIDNIITNEMILNQSDEYVPHDMNVDKNTLILCSIGRYCHQKNFDNVPNICKRVIETGLKVKWYLIGFGGDEQLIKDKIKEEGMEENVIILGKKENPYPYIKACDFYIQPSRYEGKAVTVREAQILKKPVIITRFPTSASQLVDGYDGVIVDMDNEGCAKGIIDVINNKELVDKIVSNLHKEDYSNASEVEKIYKLMED